MILQHLLIFLIFVAAAAYVARLVYNSFRGKAGGCAKGCGGGCSTINFEKITQQAQTRARS
jgi:hypothetical protein